MNDFLKYAILALCLLTACSREELPQPADRLYIRALSCPFALDGGFGSAQDGSAFTKSVDNGFLTTFEEGDRIGVTGIAADGSILDVCNNVKFTFHESYDTSDGQIWSTFLNDRGYAFVEKVEGATYFAYFPYREDLNGFTLDQIIANHTVLEDQSTKENFTKSDLMTVDAAIAPTGNDLKFILKHKMATISLFYNNEWAPDGVTPLYPIALYGSTSPASLTIEHTYRSVISPTKTELRRRYIVNPAVNPTVKLVGHLEEKSHRLFSHEINVEPGHLYSVSFEGEPMVPYTDGVDLELDNVEFVDRFGNTVTLGYTVIWSKYNLGESVGETYWFDPLPTDRGARTGTRDPYARGDYYAWGATYTQYDNGLTGYKGYGYNNYFDNEYKIAPLGGTIKETEYDVAHARWWRGKWRLPTENEFRAMYAGCTIELVESYSESQNRYMGTPGSKRTFKVFKVTSRVNPEKVIYMSSGGYLDGTMEAERDEEGNITSSGDGKKNQGIVSPAVAYYMSSSSSPTILRCVSYAYFNEASQLIKIDGSRYTGMLIRPVYSPNEYQNE